MISMDLKDWLNYSKAEKIELLKFWWFHFGVQMTELETYQSFINTIEEDPDIVWIAAVMSFTKGTGNEFLIEAIKERELLEFLLSANFSYTGFLMFKDSAEHLIKTEETLLTKLVVAYNASKLSPKPSKPSDPAKIINLAQYRNK